MLNNIFFMVEEYIKFQFNNIDNNLLSNDDNLLNFQEYFETFKNFKILYKNQIDEKEVSSFIKFYVDIIDKNKRFEGSINILKNFKKFNNGKHPENSFLSNLNEKNLDQISETYLNDYYEIDDSKRKRIYKTEHAGVNWNEEDLKKFNKGLELYGHYQLANIKIAKYMGSHIEASHVKLFRSRISKEKRIKRKYEKDTKISEMKKTRHLKWKEVEDEKFLDHI